VRLWARGDLRIPSENEPEPDEHLNDAFAAFGLAPDPEEELVLEEEFFLWPENVPAFNLWLEVQTQWHSDSGTRTGLDYTGVETCIKHMPVKKKERPWYFAAVRAMERAALTEWTKER
jgi:hypothetical protein